MLNDTAAIGGALVAFNLLPLPPLTGAHFIGAAFPGLAKPAVEAFMPVSRSALSSSWEPRRLVRPLRDALVLMLPAP